MQLEVKTPDEGVLVKGAESAVAIIQAIEIDSPEMYESAAGELAKIKGKITALDAQRTELVGPLNKVIKGINDLFRRPIEILTAGEKALKGSMLTYQQAEDDKRREAQRIADENARKERERLEEVARQQEEEARKAAQAGDTEKAEQLQADADQNRETAQVVTAPALVAPAPKAAGTSVKETWKAECTDKAALIAHIATHPELLNLVDVNGTALNQMAKALKANLAIPGVRAYPERSLSSRAA